MADFGFIGNYQDWKRRPGDVTGASREPLQTKLLCLASSPDWPAWESTGGLSERFHQVSIQPTDVACLDWWSVDLFLDDPGDIRGVIVDPGSP